VVYKQQLSIPPLPTEQVNHNVAQANSWLHMTFCHLIPQAENCIKVVGFSMPSYEVMEIGGIFTERAPPVVLDDPQHLLVFGASDEHSYERIVGVEIVLERAFFPDPAKQRDAGGRGHIAASEDLAKDRDVERGIVEALELHCHIRAPGPASEHAADASDAIETLQELGQVGGPVPGLGVGNQIGSDGRR
jgi:hypothetical protein